MSKTAAFFNIMSNPLKLRFFLLTKLPAAFFSGLKIKEMNEQSCTVTVPFKWLTQNPFRSTYFASLSMAAEMSTGILAMAHLYQQEPAVSMLVTGLEAKFVKKATDITSFTCNDGEAFKAAVTQTLQTGEGVTVTAAATGVNVAGEPVAYFTFHWSLKAKSKQ